MFTGVWPHSHTATLRVISRREPIMSREKSDGSRGWRLIKTRDFGLLWWGQKTSQIGEGLNKVVLLWFVYE